MGGGKQQRGCWSLCCCESNTLRAAPAAQKLNGNGHNSALNFAPGRQGAIRRAFANRQPKVRQQSAELAVTWRICPRRLDCREEEVEKRTTHGYLASTFTPILCHGLRSCHGHRQPTAAHPTAAAWSSSSGRRWRQRQRASTPRPGRCASQTQVRPSDPAQRRLVPHTQRALVASSASLLTAPAILVPFPRALRLVHTGARFHLRGAKGLHRSHGASSFGPATSTASLQNAIASTLWTLQPIG